VTDEDLLYLETLPPQTGRLVGLIYLEDRLEQVEQRLAELSARLDWRVGSRLDDRKAPPSRFKLWLGARLGL